MIIQCRKCETKFRFDEALIEGDGVWVRCSRCQHVFFEERSAVGEKQSVSPVAEAEIPSVRISDARRMPDEGFPDEERLSLRETQKEGYPYTSVSDTQGESTSEIDREPVIERDETGAEVAVAAPDRPLHEEGAPGADEGDEPFHAESGGRRWGWTILKVFFLVMVIAVAAGIAGFWFIPELRNQALELASPWLRSVPAVEKLIGPVPAGKGREAVPAPLRLKDVRQRSVTNLLAGNLRVIEGMAVNQASYPVGRIRVRLLISDAYDVTLGEKVVYAGNLLTDAELGALAEAEIQRELSVPQGTDFPNEKVPPNGEIPFMIVFSQEQAGAIKAVVTPAGADRVQ